MQDADLMFTCTVTNDASCARVVVSGEMDLAAVEPFTQALQQARHRGAAELVIDVRGVTFIDVAGMRLLLDAEGRPRGDARSVWIIAGDAVTRLLDLAGTRHMLRIVDARETDITPSGPSMDRERGLRSA
jgi:anti-anti-sigma factor